MNDYISREEVGKALTTAEPVNNGGIKYNRYPPSHDEVLKRISAIPAADVVEQKHGKWLDATTLDNEFICWVCSECRHGADFVYEPYNYCPNCGASMWQQEETE